MPTKKQDIITDFTRTIISVNTAYRQFLQCRLRTLKMDLTFEMLQVLACLWTKDGINQQEIANITVKDKASMTYLIDNLAKRDLLYREEDEQDRRNKRIFLSKKGKAMQAEMQPVIDEMSRQAGAGIEIEQLQQCIAVLRSIEQNLKLK